MTLCLDIGNSQIYGGVFNNEKMLLSFRKQSRNGLSSDEFGLFLRSVLKENFCDPSQIKKISVCTVVPEALHSIKNSCLKYFSINPFILQSGVKTGLQIKYRNPIEVGADRIANSVAAVHMHPKKNILIIDFGTATTFCAISRKKEYLGGCIFPGLKLSMTSLEAGTSKLPSVEILPREGALGKSTVESIQSGLYYGHLGAIKEIIKNLKKEAFGNEPFIIMGTGGFASLFKKEKIFDYEVANLVLKGLYFSQNMNQKINITKELQWN